MEAKLLPLCLIGFHKWESLARRPTANDPGGAGGGRMQVCRGCGKVRRV